MSVEQEYRDAKLRLKTNQPINVAKGTKLSLDTVAIEAGRKKGAIRRSRYPSLYDEIIKEMEETTETPLQFAQRKRDDYKSQRDHYKGLLGKALGRELLLIERIKELEKEITTIKQNNPMLLLKKL